MGPSRVNPTTGQILDADIIFDADFLQALEARSTRRSRRQSIAAMTGGPLDLQSYAGVAQAAEARPLVCRTASIAA